LPSIGELQIPILAVSVTGERFAISLSGPLTSDYPAESSVAALDGHVEHPKLVVVNELLVLGNLPAATREVRMRIGA
jgi:hypothetical protein